MATRIKQEKGVKTGQTSQLHEMAEGQSTLTTKEPRRSKRQRVAPKVYDEGEEETKRKSKRRVGGRVQWKEEELEKMLNCLKKYQRADNVRSLKKHVKTKNLEQVEAKLEHLKKKALERAMDESAGMPPLQCWEMLAKDVTNTLNDDSYKELSKVFWTATTESTSVGRKSGSKQTDPNLPNYNEIYKFLAALLRGTPPPELSPIDSMIVLECLNNTVEFLQHLKIKDQSPFLQKRYQELFLGLYANDPHRSPEASSSTSSSSSSRHRPDHSYGAQAKPKPSEGSDDEPVGLGTLNPFNIPVGKLNLIRPPPCLEHGNMYCWLPECKERRQQTQQSQPSTSS